MGELYQGTETSLASLASLASCVVPFPSMAASDPPFSRILVPVDFIPADDEAVTSGRAVVIGNQTLEFAHASEEAVRLAASLAKGRPSTVRLVHATPPLNMGTVYTGPVGVPMQVVDEVHQRAKAMSLAVLAVLRDRLCADVETVELEARPGVPLDLVLEEARSFEADLIIMAASGRSRVARFFIGSTVDRVVRQAECPVMIVPARLFED